MNTNVTALRDADAPVYSYWQAVWMSFFSPRLYVDVGKRWKGLGLVYFLLLTAVAAIPVAVHVGVRFNAYFDNTVLKPLESLPPLYIQNGSVVVDRPMPWRITGEDGKVVGVIDTTGKITSFSDTDPGTTFLVTKNRLMLQFPQPHFFDNFPLEYGAAREIQLPLDDAGSQMFVVKDWADQSGLGSIKWFSMITIYPILVGVIYFFFLLMMLSVSLIGQLMSSLFLRFQLTWPVASRLVMVAVTPAMLAFMTLIALNIYFPGIGFLMVCIFAIYFFFGAIALKRESMGIALG
ncbi:hypothetical protein Lgee_1624 [Legionella geestiana]|uniref:Uncharacterized protein n=1 Tax=Legionella geestiana TaxID=45065 RepID=A0A0W0TRP6_9GAMM|nr:DUF1189 family protein [Legionella geestiana]KTC98322.1 hypothetical protein Lgee_1624 [Legionella geestiana]QBS11369.1 DUF1189 domain-containing protein [Legionella geestiana]QDQ38921.1 DUF1189 domain-containing protein [Legionella geestiana]STX53977.1 Protein of uncharacterised function (DUF1189) [Legionella geestiana]